MPETFRLILNNSKRYDEVLDDSLRQAGDVEIIVKHDAMMSGRAAVMVTLDVELPDGTIARAQGVTTMRIFRSLCSTVLTAYDDNGMPVTSRRAEIQEAPDQLN